MHFRHAKEKRDATSLSYKGWQVFISVAVFWIVVSLIPVYNKTIFSGAAGDKGFPYPLTTTFFQLLLCAFSLTLFSVIRHWSGFDTKNKTWFFGKGFRCKIKHTATVGSVFGLKFGVTNWGLHVLQLAPHLLLQSTDLMWTVIFAHLINREKLDFSEVLCCVGSVVGTMLIAVRTHQTMPEMFPLLINLISPILLGLTVSELRRATKKLLIDESHPEGKVPHMDSFELTAYKLWFSSAVVLPFAYCFEEYLAAGQELTYTGKLPVTDALRTQSVGLTMAAIGGGYLILIFQVNVTWLCKLTSAISVGIVGGVKVVPQWLVAVCLTQSIDLSFYNLLGAFILLASSIFWTKIKYGNINDNVKSMQAMNDAHQKHLLLPLGANGDNEKDVSNLYGSLSDSSKQILKP